MTKSTLDARKKLTIWICEDDVDNWEFLRGAILEEHPTAVLKFYTCAAKAAKSTGSPDFILLDVGGISAMGCDVIAIGVANVDALSELHPGAVFILYSAIAQFAADLQNEVKERCQSVILSCGYDMEEITDYIKEWA